MPRDINKDNMEGFRLKDDYCSVDGPWKGLRYWKDKDPAVILIYDVNGYIAGLSTSVPKSQYTPPEKQQGKAYIDDGDYWTITAYFVDPATICTGRSAAQYKDQGTGTQLYLQLTTNPLESTPITTRQRDHDSENNKWTKMKCFPAMGRHYWYNISKKMSCDDFVPYFLLYSRGYLRGFGFNILADIKQKGKRYEPVPHRATKLFFKVVPDCFAKLNVKQTTSLHVYLHNVPQFNLC
jgi:charged multivesicular body protein 7